LSVSTPAAAGLAAQRGEAPTDLRGAIAITSTGSGKAPSTGTRLLSSAMQTKRSARSATIFSRVSAAPPPLIMWPRGSISSAPSM
jgi:hypothetical protein